MAAGQIYKGKNLRINFDGKTLFHATSCSLSISTTLEEIATKDTSGSMVVPGNYTWSLTSAALFADKPAGATQVDAGDLILLQLSGHEIDVEFTTEITGDRIFSGKVYIENSGVNAEVGSSATSDFSFKGNGDLTLSVVE